MRKMKIETTIQNLKKMHESYTQEVARLEKEYDAICLQLSRYRNLVSRTSDSIDALEGRTSAIREQLTQALQVNVSGTNTLKVMAETITAGSVVEIPKDLPLAESGYEWVRNGIGEWVLVPSNAVSTNMPSQSAPLIELPPISDDEEFGDKPTDFII